MAAQSGEDGSGHHQHGRGSETHHKASKRRNTVHSSSVGQSSTASTSSTSAAAAASNFAAAAAAAAAAAPWPPLAVNYPPPQPIFVPIYSPFWSLAPSANNLGQTGMIPTTATGTTLPLTPTFAPLVHGRPSHPSSRSGSPQRRGRPRVRSSERLSETDDGAGGGGGGGGGGGPRTGQPRSNATRREDRPLVAQSPMTGGDLEGFPPWPVRPIMPENHHPNHHFNHQHQHQHQHQNQHQRQRNLPPPPPPLPPHQYQPHFTPAASAPPFAHHPSSVPSTPRQRPRKLSTGAPSPPPREDANHSPRSVRSESNGHLPALRPLPVGCRFETGMAFPRRRMPYSLGGDALDRSTTGAKKHLEPDEERKLSGDMRELYDRLLPSADSERRARFIGKLHRLLNEQWPGRDIQVRVFGSSGNLLCTSDSDVDICIVTPMKELERVCLLAKVLADHGMERVVCVPNAKVPIVKMWDPELRLACDMNVNNTLALENTRLIKTYVEIDPRVRPLAMVVKHWTKRRVLNDAAFGGTLSSYTWICLILNFLQTREPPVPSLHHRPHQKLPAVNGVESAFADDIDSLRGYGEANRQTIGELLFHFFRYYGWEVDYGRDVVSLRQGRLISKVDKGWHLMQNNRMCVEEPFNIHRNLGNTADDASFRGLHIELRRAFSLIANEVNLDACCEEYFFPPEEERVWEKPIPQPRPILSRSSSQSGRGPRGHGRGGRHQNNNSSSNNNNNNNGNSTGNSNIMTLQGQRGIHGGRRASSSAAFGNMVPNFLGYQQLTVATHDAYRATAAAAAAGGIDLQEHLQQSYRLLQAQKHELALMQAQAQAQVHGQPSQTRRDGSTRKSHRAAPAHLSSVVPGVNASIDHAPHTAPLRPQMFFYPLQYVPAQSYLAPGVTTSPSSPSMVPVQPQEPRRGAHVPLVVNGSDSSGPRSHSQPARPLRSSLRMQAVPSAKSTGNDGIRIPPNDRSREPPGRDENHQVGGGGGSSSGGYQASRASRARPVLNTTQSEDIRRDDTPKEYVGWYVDGSPSALRPFDEMVLRSVPTFGDLSPPAIYTAPPHRTTFEGTDLRLQTHGRPIFGDAPPDAASEARHLRSTTAETPATSEDDQPESSRTPPEHQPPLIVDGSSSTPQVDRDGQSMPVNEDGGTRKSGDAGRRSVDQPEGGMSATAGGVFTVGREPIPLVASENDQRRTTTSLRQGVGPAASPPLPDGTVKPVQPNGASSPQRLPFLANGGGIQNMVKARVLATPSTAAAASLSASLSALSLDTSPVLQKTLEKTEPTRPPQTPTSGSVPVSLSPVIENRSSSPSARRPGEYLSPTRTRINGARGGRNEVVRSREPQPPPIPAAFASASGASALHGSDARDILSTKPNGYTRDLGSGGDSHTATANGWQQPTSKQHRRGAGGGSTGSLTLGKTSGGAAASSAAAAATTGKKPTGPASPSPSAATPAAWATVSNQGSEAGPWTTTSKTRAVVPAATTAAVVHGHAPVSATAGAGETMPMNEAERKGG